MTKYRVNSTYYRMKNSSSSRYKAYKFIITDIDELNSITGRIIEVFSTINVINTKVFPDLKYVVPTEYTDFMDKYIYD